MAKNAKLIDHARTGIRRFLGLSQTAARATPLAPTPGAARAPIRPIPSPNLTAFDAPALRALLGDRSVLTIGKLSLIGLNPIRAALGAAAARWEVRIQSAANSIIRTHLRQGDLFADLGEGGYALVFADLSHEEAELKCARITQEIKQWLLGTEATSSIDVHCRMVQLAASNLGSESDLRAALAGSLRSPPSGAGASTRPLSAVSTRNPNDAPSRPETQRAPPAQSGAGAVARPSHVSAAFRDGDHPTRGTSSDANARGVALHYEPVWDARGEALLLFRLVAIQAATSATASMIDLGALHRAQHDLGAVSRKGRRFPVLLPLSLETVGNGGRPMAYLDALREAPVAIRQLMIIEIPMEEGGGHDASAVRFAERVRALGFGFAVRCSLYSADMPALKRLGARIATIETSNVASMSKAVLDALERFAEMAAANGLECGLLGARSTSIATAAATAGFRFISGSAIHAPIASLAEVTRFRPLDLFLAPH